METLGISFQRLGLEPYVYDNATGFALLSTADWCARQQDLLEKSLSQDPRPILIGNPDIVAPRETGLTLEPGHIAYQLNRQLDLLRAFYGKPIGNTFELAFTRLGNADPKRVAMVGDSLHTDVLGGAAHGLETVLVTDHGLFSGWDYKLVITQTGIVPNYIIPTN